LFTENIYRPLVPGKSQRHYVGMGRATSLAVVAGGIVFAYWVPDVITALKIWFRIAPMMGVAFWLGLFWRRMTVAGAWATTLAGFAVWFLATRQFAVDLVAQLPFPESARLVWLDQGKLEIYEPWVIVFYTVAAAGAGIVVSLLSRPVAREKLDRFYNLTRTPIVPNEQIDEPCTLPAGVAPARRRMLVHWWGLEVPMPSRTSLVGFLVGWIMVAALVGGFWLLVGAR
jgi:Na+/proline symporter